jgi:hypothetical protein
MRSLDLFAIRPLEGNREYAFKVSLLKTRPRRLSSCGLRTDPLLDRHGQMVLDRSWDTAVGGAHAAGVGTREPRTSAATRRVEGSPVAAATDEDGPNLLGSAIETVDELAAFVAAGSAGDRGPLAPGRISTLLGVEESTTIRSARNQYGGARSDSTDEPGQSAGALREFMASC